MINETEKSKITVIKTTNRDQQMNEQLEIAEKVQEKQGKIYQNKDEIEKSIGFSS